MEDGRPLRWEERRKGERKGKTKDRDRRLGVKKIEY
jgi:hypothetical protein